MLLGYRAAYKYIGYCTLPSHDEAKAAQSMGCEDIEDQLRLLRSSAHVYGHSRVRTCEEHGKVLFINNHHGNGAEGAQPPSLLLVFDGSQGGVVVSDSRAPKDA